MKLKTLFATIVAGACVASCSAFDFKNLIGGGGSNTDNNTNNQSTSSSVVSGLLGAVSQLISGSDVEYSQLVGNWSYVKPAVSFESENFLKQAGGAAAAGVVEDKLAPYYAMAGVDKMTISFAQDSTFTMQVGRLPLQGRVSCPAKGQYTFTLQAFGAVPTGSVTAYVARNLNNVNITFDASRLIAIVRTIASVSGNSTIQTVSNLLDSYEGINIGVEVKKQ